MNATDTTTQITKPGPVRLSFLSTGMVKIRMAVRSQPLDCRPALMRQLKALRDSNWTGDLPIGVFVIHHPDGPILFDTGASPCFNDKKYLPLAGFLTKYASTISIAESEGVVPQLRKLGIEPSRLQKVVISHLHHDHAGGLEAILEEAGEQGCQVPVLVGSDHYEAFVPNPTWADFHGCASNHWPAPGILKPVAPEQPDAALQAKIAPWEKCYPITSDNSVVAVDTPGHVLGHISLIVFGNDATGGKETTYFLPGDATYGIDLLKKEETDGLTDDPEGAVHSLQMINEFCRRRKVVVLPSHDPEVEKLLAEKTIYRPPPSNEDKCRK